MWPVADDVVVVGGEDTSLKTIACINAQQGENDCAVFPPRLIACFSVTLNLDFSWTRTSDRVPYFLTLFIFDLSTSVIYPCLWSYKNDRKVLRNYCLL